MMLLPIESAPKNSTRILLFRPGSHASWARIGIGLGRE